MSKAYYKDIKRSIKKEWKRFLSILIITTLGVGMMSGLYAACLDMYDSADRFFDKQNLFDIRILSTLGLTQEDIEALEKVDGVQTVEGGYTESVYIEMDEARKEAQVTVISSKGINMPHLLEGRMPSKRGEIAVTQKYLKDSGVSIGDVLVVEESIQGAVEDNTEESKAVKSQSSKDESKSNFEDDFDLEIEEKSNLLNTMYTITGVVLDPMDIQSDNNTINAFRSSMNVDYTFFITESDVKSDIFTAAYILLEATKEMNFYSKEYENRVQSLITNMEQNIKSQREQARYDSVMLEARKKIEDAQITMEEKFAEAEEKFADGWEEIESSRLELEDGEDTLLREQEDAEQKIREAREEINNGKKELEKAKEGLEEGEKEFLKGKTELTEGEKKLKKSERQLIKSEEQLKEGEIQLEEGETELSEKAEELAKGKVELEKERKTTEVQLTTAKEQMSEAQKELDQERSQLENHVTWLKRTFGDLWPEQEWLALTNAVAVLTVGGADDKAIITGTSAERMELQEALQKSGEQFYSFVETGMQSAVGMGKINGGQQVLDAKKTAFKEQEKAAWQQLNEAEAELMEGEKQIEAASKTLKSKRKELELAKEKLTEGRKELKDAKEELSKGKAKLEQAEKDLDKGQKEFLAGNKKAEEGETKLNKEEEEAKAKIDDAWKELYKGKKELAEGEEELLQQEQEYKDKKEEAKRKLADAYDELKDMDMTQWYMEDRTYLESYSSLNSDLSSIEAIGNVFPVIFLFVAILMSLTTMTRMVEEERSLIGTYKALGFGNAAVYRKYLIFAFTACLAGGILGDIFGFIFMPKFISVILKEMYTLPKHYLSFDAVYGVGGVLLFMVSILGATMLACRSELNQMPASLLRPKAPRAGARVFLERIPFVWSRLKFLNKVTIRNLFRYKKRLFMTVGGIMSCTALILCGFAIKNSVFDLAPKQYGEIYKYDLMAVFEEKNNEEQIQHLSEEGIAEQFINLRIESVKLVNKKGESEKVQLMIIPDGGSIEEYVHLESLNGTQTYLDDRGVMITQNAARMLGLKTGATVSIQNMKLDQQEVVLSGVVKNYLGNSVYMTEKLYETIFGDYSPNAVLAYLSDGYHGSEYVEALLHNESVLSATSTATLREDFEFDLIDSVVLLLTAMAGGLAFVVLFTLSNTNISERIRELATIKVLGFYDTEVYQYVNKETLGLTVVGILIGLPVGRILSGFLTIVLNMPSIHFAVHIEPASYLISAGITFFFAIIVNWITNRVLDRINMVEALKSVE